MPGCYLFVLGVRGPAVQAYEKVLALGLSTKVQTVEDVRCMGCCCNVYILMVAFGCKLLIRRAIMSGWHRKDQARMVTEYKM